MDVRSIHNTQMDRGISYSLTQIRAFAEQSSNIARQQGGRCTPCT